jgi:hypothetical protein
MKKVFLSVAVLATLFASCKKDDDNNNKSRHDMMVGTWMIDQFGADVNNNQTIDIGETSDSALNGFFTFSANGALTTASHFIGLPADTLTGTWALVNNDNYLQLVSDDGDTSYSLIKSISNNNLTLLDTSNAAIWFVLAK